MLSPINKEIFYFFFIYLLFKYCCLHLPLFGFVHVSFDLRWLRLVGAEVTYMLTIFLYPPNPIKSLESISNLNSGKISLDWGQN